MPVSKLNVLQTLCYLLSTFLNYLDKHGGFGEEDQRLTTTAAGSTYAKVFSPSPTILCIQTSHQPLPRGINHPGIRRKKEFLTMTCLI
jgi:hypothetical protein